MRFPPAPIFHRLSGFISGLALVLAANVQGQTALPKSSPFLPAGSPTAAEAANEVLEFAGVSSMGKKTQIVIYDKSTKKSRWIGVGETVDGIAVLNYDSRLEQTVVRSNGVQKVLTLRKGGGAAQTPAPVAALPVGFATPPAPAPASVPPAATLPPPPAPVASTPVAMPAKPEAPPTPETQARQETEARMLVSDLLEIGMAQRKAYEEAQRKASDPSAQQQPPSPPPADKPASPGSG